MHDKIYNFFRPRYFATKYVSKEVKLRYPLIHKIVGILILVAAILWIIDILKTGDMKLSRPAIYVGSVAFILEFSAFFLSQLKNRF